MGNPNGAYGGGPRYGDDTATPASRRSTRTIARSSRAQFREWQGDAEELRRELQHAGVNPRDLDEVIRDLRQFGNERRLRRPEGLEKLQAAALEKLKKFEFNLRRKAEPARIARAVGIRRSAGGLPQAIEEYYRQLAKNKK